MKRTVLIFFLLFSLHSLLFAEEILINQTPFNVEILHSDNSTTIIDYTFGSFHRYPVDIEGKNYYHINLGNEANLLEKGEPALPHVSRSIIIPDFALTDIRVTASNYVDLMIDIAPSKGNLLRIQDPAEVPYTFSDVYQKDGFYPDLLVLLDEPYILRDFRGQVVRIYPFQYNPVTRILRVYHQITVEVNTIGIDIRNVKYRQRDGYNRDFESIYQNRFLNFSHTRYTPLEEQGRMIVIAFDAFVNSTIPYVNWKNQKGIPTTIYPVSTIGTTATAIMNFIQQEYNLNDGLTFVQLVGDAAQIPTFTVGGGGSDPSYSLLEGNDAYGDIFVGRFSAENVDQVQTQVERTIHYERDMNISDTWLTNAMGIASNEGAGIGYEGLSDIQHLNLIRDQLITYNYTLVDQIYAPSATATMVTDAINAGRGLANYTGHGSNTSWGTTGFSNTNVNALVNDYKLPFIVSVACVNGNFTATTCFAEAWLRAINNTTGVPTGAVAMYASTVNQSWAPPMSAQREIANLLVADAKTTIGGLFFNGSFFMIDVYPTTGATEFKNWHIFGDASLQVRSNVPQTMNVTYNTAIPIGVNTLQVNTGVANALVALTTPDYQILAYGYANSSGTVTLNMTDPPTVPMALNLTATAYNRVTHTGTVEVLPAEGPYVILENYTLNGNQTYTPQYNELISFSVTLTNMGSDPAANVSALLTSVSAGVTILDNTENFGTIAADGSITRPNAFSIQTADNLPDQTTLNFTIVITSGTDSWSSDLSFNINSPALEVTNFHIQDPAPGGNNNGRLDPGEIVTLNLVIENAGHAASQSGTASLTVNNPLITISDPVFNLSPINPSATINSLYTVAIDESINPGTVVEFTQTIDYGAYTTVYNRSLPVGLVLEDFETGNFTSFPWTFSGNANWTIDTSTVYEGVYSAKSGLITHSQNTSLQVTLNIASNSQISFYRKVSSESNYDFLRFFINDVQQAQWSGEVDWSQVSYPVNAGERTFRWTYIKDGSVSTGSDCAWVDYIVFPELLPQDSPRNLIASAGNGYVNLSWSAPVDGIPLSYNIYRNGTVLNNTGLLNYNDNSVINGVTYTYYVTAIFSTYESGPSNIVEATPNPIQIVEIGTGTNVNGTSTAAPINIYYRSLRGQMVYTAAEINAAGFSGPGEITHLGFFVTQTPLYSLPNFIIRMKHTTATNASAHDAGPYQTVYMNTSYSPVAGGWDMLQLSVPFEWNGVDNILVDTAFAQVPAYNASGQQRIFDSINGFRYIWSDAADQTNNATTTTTNYKPQIRINFVTGEPTEFPPPTNLVAILGNAVVNLSWQSPAQRVLSVLERVTGRIDSEVTDFLLRNLTGYNIYRDGEFLNSVAADVTVYSDTDVINNVTYSYYVTAVYNLEESNPTNVVTATPSAYYLIWNEDFSPPHAGWTLGSNWSFQDGYMRFYWSPTVTNYDMSALSPNIVLPDEVGDLVITQLYDDYSAVDEMLAISIIHGGEETVLWTYNCSNGSFSVNDFIFSLAPFAGDTIQIRFRSYGSTTWNVNWWNIYNISISGFIGDPYYGVIVSPEMATESGYANSIVDYTITVTNTGNITDNYELAVSDNTWNLSFWEATRDEDYREVPYIELEDGIVYMEKTPAIILSEITETGFIQAGQSKQILIKVNIPGGATGSDTAVIEIISQSDNEISTTMTIETISLGQDPSLPAEPRYIAEWEPMEGVLIRYPLGIPYALIREFSNDTQVYTIVTSGNLTTATTNYQNNNVNMDNCHFIVVAATDSYWTRDYGPWSISTANGIGIADFTYDRPSRPNDNLIPGIISNYFDIPYYLMPLTLTGGNMMGDGVSVAASTDLVFDTNPGMTASQIDQIFYNYLGIDIFHKRPHPSGDTLKHIDTWAKFLDVDKIMIRSVHTGHAQYSQIEAAADYFANQISSYGTPYQVYRVYTPNNEPYTNSIIVNNKVYVPITGSANDTAAIVSYQQAMPGYEVVGFTGSWHSNDALHCRVMGLADQGMLYVDHIPSQTYYSGMSIPVEVQIKAYSGLPLMANELRVYWKSADSATYNYVPLIHEDNDIYVTTIPSQPYGEVVHYYISAADQSGRVEKRPYMGASDPFVIEINEIGFITSPENVQISIDDGNVYISWEEVEGATDYVIEASASIDGDFIPATHLGTISQNGNLITWESSIPGIMQFYRVIALSELPALRRQGETPQRGRIRE